jgi:hypothetical protein
MKYEGLDTWVSVFEAANIDEANIVKGLLKVSDIPVHLEREAAGSIYGLTAGPLSEVVVKVPKEMASLATQLLQSTPFSVVPEE